MDIEERIDLVLKPPTQELVTREELRELLETEERPKHYIGFEISGLIHLGTGYISACKIRDLEDAGFETTILFADYHSWINRKLGDDLDKIRKVANTYYTHAFRSLGLEKTRFVFSYDLYQDIDYWTKVIQISKEMTISRVMRTLTIMGRKEGDANRVADLLYTPMQVADIFFLGVHLAHAGMDQRKAHMAARDVAPKIGERKPIALHHSLLLGLKEPRRAGYDQDEVLDLQISSKMSKSRPDTCIFIHDSEEEIRRKVRNAFCPPGQVENNPVMEHFRHIVFREYETIEIDREEKYGGCIEINGYDELAEAYRSGKIHPADLKNALSEYLIKILERPRKYFEMHPEILSVLSTPI